MATLVLATVGTAIAGPIGGLVGSFLGASIDRRLFGSGSQSGARASNLAVQSSAYGEAIPRFYGRMRAAGNLIWCPGIREAKGQSGGGKQRSGSGYSYSASFAVALAARQIHGIGRIWADGKLMRNADGSFVSATTMRIYFGTEGQLADPLIVGAEGTANAPAYRGLAYVVFENLALADFANRIPNLTFEIIADDDDADAATVAMDLFGAADVMLPTVSGAFPVFHGFAATRAGNLRTQLEALAPLADLSFADNGSALVLRSGDALQAVEILAEALGAAAAGETGGTRQQDGRGSIATVPDALAIGFFDPARDYQLGLQRVVRRSPAVRNEQRDFAVALAAPAAKALAERLVGGALAARTTAELRVSWQHLPIGVGDTVFAGGDTQAWRVRSLSFESMVLRLSVERTASVPRRAAGSAPIADPGRSLVSNDLPNGPTVLQLLDLPALPGALPMTPRIWVAAAGESRGWRNAQIDVSTDAGDSYTAFATISAETTMGFTDDALAAGSTSTWDWRSTVDVTLANTEMWLESRTLAAVIAGANLALVGDELIQFAQVEALAPGKFRLRGLLRGRRGTELQSSHHAVGDRFVLIEPDRMLAFDPPIDSLGRMVQFRASHRSDAAAYSTASIVPTGLALQPLSPVRLGLAVSADGGLVARWIRRSRAGYGWIDATDVPIAEERERYQVELRSGSRLVRRETVDLPVWHYAGSERLADGIGNATTLVVRVAQISGAVGAGNVAEAEISLPST